MCRFCHLARRRYFLRQNGESEQQKGEFGRYLECVDSVAVLIQSVHEMHGGQGSSNREDEALEPTSKFVHCSLY